MRLIIRHDTIYRYTTPPSSVIQHLRLTPRGYEGLFIRKWRVEINADCRLDRSEDAFGNVVHTFTADGPVNDLRISVEGAVETFDTAGIVRASVERFPLSVWMRETPLTVASAAMREFASDIASAEGGDQLATLHAINAAIFANLRFAVGDTDAQTTAATAFAAKAGVCQDFAHVFVATARSIGIPARYISGYFLRTDADEQDAGHAWAEAYLDNIGWVGFDPAHGVCTSDRYVRVAAGLDYLDAAPIRGARIGGAGEWLTVNVHVSQGPMIAEA